MISRREPKNSPQRESNNLVEPPPTPTDSLSTQRTARRRERGRSVVHTSSYNSRPHLKLSFQPVPDRTNSLPPLPTARLDLNLKKAIEKECVSYVAFAHEARQEIQKFLRGLKVDETDSAAKQTEPTAIKTSSIFGRVPPELGHADNGRPTIYLPSPLAADTKSHDSRPRTSSPYDNVATPRQQRRVVTAPELVNNRLEQSDCTSQTGFDLDKPKEMLNLSSPCETSPPEIMSLSIKCDKGTSTASSPREQSPSRRGRENGSELKSPVLRTPAESGCQTTSTSTPLTYSVACSPARPNPSVQHSPGLVLGSDDTEPANGKSDDNGRRLFQSLIPTRMESLIEWAENERKVQRQKFIDELTNKLAERRRSADVTRQPPILGITKADGKIKDRNICMESSDAPVTEGRNSSSPKSWRSPSTCADENVCVGTIRGGCYSSCSSENAASSSMVSASMISVSKDDVLMQEPPMRYRVVPWKGFNVLKI